MNREDDMIKLLIYDNDEKYAARLAGALARGGRELMVERATPGLAGREGVAFSMIGQAAPGDGSVPGVSIEEDVTARSARGEDGSDEPSSQAGRAFPAAGRDTLGGGDSEGLARQAHPYLPDGHNAGPKGRFDFVLTDERSWALAAGLFPEACVLVLAERAAAPGREVYAAPYRPTAANSADVEEQNGRILLVNRYGRVSGLLSLIRREHAARSGVEGLDALGIGEEPETICCLGLSGGCGASSVAIGLGRELAAHKERRVLYLSLEPMESDGLCLGGAAEQVGQDVGGFLYAMLKGGTRNAGALIDGYLYKDRYGLERFRPSQSANDLSALPLSDLKLLAGGALAGRFEVIVFDLGNGLCEKARWLAGDCDALVLVANGGADVSGKEKKMADLALEGWGAKGKRVVMVSNMAGRDGQTEGQDAVLSGGLGWRAYSEAGKNSAEPKSRPRFSFSLPASLPAFATKKPKGKQAKNKEDARRDGSPPPAAYMSKSGNPPPAKDARKGGNPSPAKADAEKAGKSGLGRLLPKLGRNMPALPGKSKPAPETAEKADQAAATADRSGLAPITAPPAQARPELGWQAKGCGHFVEIPFDKEGFTHEDGMTEFTLSRQFGAGISRVADIVLGD